MSTTKTCPVCFGRGQVSDSPSSDSTSSSECGMRLLGSEAIAREQVDTEPWHVMTYGKRVAQAQLTADKDNLPSVVEIHRKIAENFSRWDAATAIHAMLVNAPSLAKLTCEWCDKEYEHPEIFEHDVKTYGAGGAVFCPHCHKFTNPNPEFWKRNMERPA